MGYWTHVDRIFALLLSSWVCPCRQTHCAHLWLRHRTSPHFEFRMLVMFAPTNSNSSLVAPWQQYGLKIEWTSLKGPTAKEIVNTNLIYPPQRLIVPSAIGGKQGRPGISFRREKGIKSAKASIRYEMLLSYAPVSILKNICRFDGTSVNSSLMPCVHKAVADTSEVIFESSFKNTEPCPVDPAIPSQSTSLQVMKNLCRTMQSCGMRSECLELLVDANQGDQYQVSSQPEHKLVAGDITIREILHPDHKPKVSQPSDFRLR